MTSSFGRGKEAALSLYRSLLRAHAKYLPMEMRQLGDAYVKAEFRHHRGVTNAPQLEQFFQEWNFYLEQITSTAHARAAFSTHGGNQHQSILDKSDEIFQFGSDLPEHVKLSEEQQVQLQKLKEKATKPKNK